MLAQAHVYGTVSQVSQPTSSLLVTMQVFVLQNKAEPKPTDNTDVTETAQKFYIKSKIYLCNRHVKLSAIKTFHT